MIRYYLLPIATGLLPSRCSPAPRGGPRVWIPSSRSRRSSRSCTRAASLPLGEDRYGLRAGRRLCTPLLGGLTFRRGLGQRQIEFSLEHHSSQEVAIGIAMELEPGRFAALSAVSRVRHEDG